MTCVHNKEDIFPDHRTKTMKSPFKSNSPKKSPVKQCKTPQKNENLSGLRFYSPTKSNSTSKSRTPIKQASPMKDIQTSRNLWNTPQKSETELEFEPMEVDLISPIRSPKRKFELKDSTNTPTKTCSPNKKTRSHLDDLSPCMTRLKPYDCVNKLVSK